MESGGFEASDIKAVYPEGGGVAEAPVLPHVVAVNVIYRTFKVTIHM